MDKKTYENLTGFSYPVWFEELEGGEDEIKRQNKDN